MRLQRGDLTLEREGGEIRLHGATDGGSGLAVLTDLDLDDLRWLAFVALPALIAEVPSEAPVKVRDVSNDDGQIPGQLAID